MIFYRGYGTGTGICERLERQVPRHRGVSMAGARQVISVEHANLTTEYNG